MLYKFKSKATGDLIMLEPNGRQMLTLMGKGDTDNLVKGILEPADMSAAVSALQRAVSQDDALRANAKAQPKSAEEHTTPLPPVSLRQRATPLLDMLQRCQTANTPIVWGV